MNYSPFHFICILSFQDHYIILLFLWFSRGFFKSIRTSAIQDGSHPLELPSLKQSVLFLQEHKPWEALLSICIAGHGGMLRAVKQFCELPSCYRGWDSCPAVLQRNHILGPVHQLWVINGQGLHSIKDCTNALLSNAGFVRSMFKGVIKCNCGLKLSLEISTYIILATEATNQQEAQSKSISSSAKSWVLLTFHDFTYFM